MMQTLSLLTRFRFGDSSGGWKGKLLSGLSDEFPRVKISVQQSNRLFRILRSVVGGMILITIVSGILLPQVLPVSGNSIVNARLSWHRTPINGDWTINDYNVGDTVSKGSVIGAIENLRADDNYLNGLRSEESALKTTLFTMQKRLQGFESRRDELKQRVTDSLKNLRDRTDVQVKKTQVEIDFYVEQNNEIDEKISRYESANREFPGSEPYAVVSRSVLESLHASRAEIEATINGQLNIIYTLKSALRTAVNGTYASDNTPPEQQQLNDVEQAIVAVESEIQSLVLRAEKLSVDIADREIHHQRNKNHDLVSQVSGTLWDIGFADGSYVNSGDSLIAVADTNSLVVEAIFHQRYLDNVAVGDHATVDLMGSDQRLTGRVSEVRIRDQVKSMDLRAFNFTTPDANEFKVVVTIDEGLANTPRVGQRSKVIINRSSSRVIPNILLFVNR